MITLASVSSKLIKSLKDSLSQYKTVTIFIHNYQTITSNEVIKPAEKPVYNINLKVTVNS